MKILVVAPTQFYADRGTPIRIREHLESLKRRGHEIVVVTYKGGADIPGIRIIRTPHFWTSEGDRFYIESFWRRIFLDMLMVYSVLMERIRFRPTMLLCYLHNGFLVGYLASFGSARRLAFDCHGLLVKEATEKGIKHSEIVRHVIILVEKYMYRIAPLITVPSENIRREILRRYTVGHGGPTVATDGYSSSLLSCRADVAATQKMKSDLSIQKNHPVIIFTGYLSKIAGVDLLLEAFARVSKQSPHSVLIVLGYPFVEEYKKLAEKLGIRDWVKFTGSVAYSSLGSYLAVADIAVAPRISGAEGNFKIVNYLAAGLPVVCFDTPPNRELAEGLAIYPTSTTSEALSEAIRVAAARLPEHSFEAEKRKAFVTSRFSWDGLADALEKRSREAAL